jgi:hypothetical protein
LFPRANEGHSQGLRCGCDCNQATCQESKEHRFVRKRNSWNRNDHRRIEQFRVTSDLQSLAPTSCSNETFSAQKNWVTGHCIDQAVCLVQMAPIYRTYKWIDPAGAGDHKFGERATAVTYLVHTHRLLKTQSRAV